MLWRGNRKSASPDPPALPIDAAIWPPESATLPRGTVLPPDEIPPAVAYGIINGVARSWQPTRGSRGKPLILATLVDLIARGFYDVTTTAGVDMDLTLALPAARRALPAQFELPVLDFFDRLLEPGPCELEKLVERTANTVAWRQRWDEVFRALQTAYLSVEPDRVAQLAAIGRPVSPEQLQREWRQFAKWTARFPKLEAVPNATADTWRQILTHSLAFGTAYPILRSARDPQPTSGKHARDVRIPSSIVQQIREPGAPWHPLMLTDYDGHVAVGCFQFGERLEVRIYPPDGWSGDGAGTG